MVVALLGAACAGCAAPAALPLAPQPTGADIAACRDVRAVIGEAADALPALARGPVVASTAFLGFAAAARAAGAAGSEQLVAATERVAHAYDALAASAARGDLPRTGGLRSAVAAFTAVCGLSDATALS